MPKVRSITTARTAGPLGQFYKALVKSGAWQCGKCHCYVSDAHLGRCLSGVPAVSQRWDFDLPGLNVAPADPVDREWNELDAEEVNTRGKVA